ncbi:MAG TPA: glycosyltransferase [Pilimelia sp.]|nr:glycosyltransferase [Pilimelia sp.]
MTAPARPGERRRGEPSIGVVIPTRDRPGLLRRALDAVLAQAYPGRIAVVVVYDQAPPDPALAALGGTGRTVRVIENRRAPGLAGARNTGILSLDTDLVAFCDDDDTWAPGKLRRQVGALLARPGAEFATCAIEVEFEGRHTPRLAGLDTVTVDQLARSRMAMLHSSTFLAHRRALTAGVAGADPASGIGLVAEDAPGSQNEDWDLLLRAARRAPIVHVDEPLVRVLWGRTSHYAYEYATKISSLRWMIARHPEIRGCPPGAARVYGQIACWSAATGNRREAWVWARRAARANWREPRAAIAVAALSGAVNVEQVIAVLHRRGRGI